MFEVNSASFVFTVYYSSLISTCMFGILLLFFVIQVKTVYRVVFYDDVPVETVYLMLVGCTNLVKFTNKVHSRLIFT